MKMFVLRGLRTIKSVILRLPGGRWLLQWTFPLFIARHLLEKAMIQCAHYAKGQLLDVGCGYQPYREIFSNVDHYVGIDLPGHGKFEVAGSALALPFRPEIFDTVLCNEVLEHVPEPILLFSEVERVLKPGGVLLLTTPQTWGLHLEPYDYYRYTKYGLKYLAEKQRLQVIEVGPTCGMWATWSQRLADTVIHTYAAAKPQRLIIILSVMLAPVLMVGYMLDKLFGKRGDTLDNLLVAQKPDEHQDIPHNVQESL